jgi:hypothetical protein
MNFKFISHNKIYRKMKNVLTTVVVLILGVSGFAQTPVNLKFNLEKGKINQVKSISKQNIRYQWPRT